MNLYFRITLFFFFSMSVFSRDIVVIQYTTNKSLALYAENLLLNQYNIPKSFIRTEQTQKTCDSVAHAFLHICIEENNISYPTINEEGIMKALATFTQIGKGNNYEH